MLIRVCKGKIHRATVTNAVLDYIGSIEIDSKLLKASGIAEYQMVIINNLSNGVSWQTYTVGGKEGSGVVCLNGPPARHFQPGDMVIILGEGFIDASEGDPAEPVVVIVKDKENKQFEIKPHKEAMLSNKA